MCKLSVAFPIFEGFGAVLRAYILLHCVEDRDIVYIAQPVTVGGPSPIKRGPCPPERGIAMVTYSELFAYTLVIISVASLVLQYCKRK